MEDKMANNDPPTRANDGDVCITIKDKTGTRETAYGANDSGFSASITDTVATEETSGGTNSYVLGAFIADKVASEETPNRTNDGVFSVSIADKVASEETPNRTNDGVFSVSIADKEASEETPNRTNDSGLGASFGSVDLSSSSSSRNLDPETELSWTTEAGRARRQRAGLHAENATPPLSQCPQRSSGSSTDVRLPELCGNDRKAEEADGQKKKKGKERKKLRLFYNENEPYTCTPVSTLDTNPAHPDLYPLSYPLRPLHRLVGTPYADSPSAATHPKKEFLKRAFRGGVEREDSAPRAERPLQELQELGLGRGHSPTSTPLGLYTASPTRSPRKGLLPRTYTQHGARNRHQLPEIDRSAEEVELQGTDFSPNRRLFRSSPTGSPQKVSSADPYSHHDTGNWRSKISMSPCRSPQKTFSSKTLTYFGADDRHMHSRIERSPSRSPKKGISADSHHGTENRHLPPRLKRSLQELQCAVYGSNREGLSRASPTQSPQKRFPAETYTHHDVETRHAHPRTWRSPRGSPEKRFLAETYTHHDIENRHTRPRVVERPASRSPKKGLPTETLAHCGPDVKASSPRKSLGLQTLLCSETAVLGGDRTVFERFPDPERRLSCGPLRLNTTSPSHRSPHRDFSSPKRTRCSPQRQLSPRKCLTAHVELKRVSPRKRTRHGTQEELSPAKQLRLSPRKVLSGKGKYFSPQKGFSAWKHRHRSPLIKGSSPRKLAHAKPFSGFRQEPKDLSQSSQPPPLRSALSSDLSKHAKAFTINSILGLSEGRSPSRNGSSPGIVHEASRHTPSSASSLALAEPVPQSGHEQFGPREGTSQGDHTSRDIAAVLDTMRVLRAELMLDSPSLEHASGSLPERQNHHHHHQQNHQQQQQEQQQQPSVLGHGAPSHLSGMPDDVVRTYAHLVGLSDHVAGGGGRCGGPYDLLGGMFACASGTYGHPSAAVDLSGGLSGRGGGGGGGGGGPVGYLSETPASVTDLSRGAPHSMGGGRSSQGSGPRQGDAEAGAGSTGRVLAGSPLATRPTTGSCAPSKAAKPRRRKTETKPATKATKHGSHAVRLLTCLSVCLFVGLSVRLSACLLVFPVCLFICLPACLSACLFVHLSACSSVSLFACSSACLPVCLFVYLPICLFVRLSACLSVCLPTCLFVCLSGR